MTLQIEGVGGLQKYKNQQPAVGRAVNSVRAMFCPATVARGTVILKNFSRSTYFHN